MKRYIYIFLTITLILSGCNKSNENVTTSEGLSINVNTVDFVISKGFICQDYDSAKGLVDAFELDYAGFYDNGDDTFTLSLKEDEVEKSKDSVNRVIEENINELHNFSYSFDIKISEDYSKIEFYNDCRSNHGENVFKIFGTVQRCYAACILMQILTNRNITHLAVDYYMGMTHKYIESIDIPSTEPYEQDSWPFTYEQFKTGVSLNKKEAGDILKEYSDYSWYTIDMADMNAVDFLYSVASVTDMYKCFFTYDTNNSIKICFDKDATDLLDCFDLSWEEVEKLNKQYHSANYIKKSNDNKTLTIALNNNLEEKYKIKIVNYAASLCILSQTISDEKEDYDIEITLKDSDSNKLIAKEKSVNKIIDIIKGADND